MESEFAVENCVPGTMSTKPLGCECRRGTAMRVVKKRTHIRSSSDAKEHHRQPCSYPGRYQLLACCFWHIRDRGTIVL